MDECMWIGCVDPPEPKGFYIKSDWDGLSVYEFGETATYTCEDEGLYFEDDRAKKSFAVKRGEAAMFVCISCRVGMILFCI